MNLRFIISDFKYSVKQWLRSKGTVFWTILFPVLLIVIFGAIFSETGDVQYDLVVQDLDQSEFSQSFTKNLNNMAVLKIDEQEPDRDIKQYMKDKDIKGSLIIPKGFGENMTLYLASKQNASIPFNDENLPFNLTLIIDPSDQTTSAFLTGIITNILYEMNMNMTEGESIVGFKEESILSEEFNYIDFFVPGIIAFTIMTSMIYGSIERNTKYRKDGILRKLLTMPVTRAEWIFSKMLFMLFLSFISTIVILLVGTLIWGLSVKINIFFFILIISSSFLFSGMGMIIGRFVKEEETADMAGGAITFPMMFLAGTFFPLEQMPSFLQSIAQVLPLYYINEGLRNAMVHQNLEKTIYFSAFVLVFALVFFVIGVLVTKWKED